MPENYHAKRLPLDKGNEFRVEMYDLIKRINKILAAEKRVCALDISFRLGSRRANDKVVRVYALAHDIYRDISLSFANKHGGGLVLEDSSGNEILSQCYENNCEMCENCSYGNGDHNTRLAAWVDDIEFHPCQTTPLYAPTFDDWINHLKDNHFGRYAICLKRSETHQGQTLVMFLILKNKPSREQANKINRELWDFIYEHGLEYALFLADSLHAEAVKSTIKSAVASVMVRNLSHNIGSHVLANLSCKSDLQAIYQEHQLETLYAQLSRFNSYLRMRMDFLADIATSVPAIQIPKGLKLIISNFRSEYILRNYISGSTAIRFDNICINNPELNGNEKRNDIIFACTNESLGAHAFYVILENILRNAVKHTVLSTNILTLTVRCSESDSGSDYNKDYWKVDIVDNTRVCEPFSNNKVDRDKDINPNLIKELNEMIKKPILEEGKVRYGGWGVLEMKIAAAYLRKLPPEGIEFDTEGKEFKPPLLRASEEEGNLCYTLYLPKVKELVILNFGKDLTLKDLSCPDLTNGGIRFVDYNSEKELDQISDYQFMLLVEPSRNHLDKLKHRLNSITKRIFISGSRGAESDIHLVPLNLNKLIELLKCDNDQVKIEAFLWQTWAEALWYKKYPGCKGIVKHGKEKGIIDNCCEYIDPSSGQASEVKELLFDCHGENRPYSKAEKVIYYEQFGSNSPSGRLLGESTSYSSVLKRKIAYGLIDAALTKVVVIDERIQRYVFDNATREDACNYEKMNIFVPDRTTFDLNEQSYRERQHRTGPLDSWIDKQIETAQKNQELNIFLIVHLGVIEKLVGTDGEKIGEWISRYSKKGVSVVITSGRGKPSNIPPNTLFLHYSLVSQYLLENRSKYHLTKILYASREVKA